MGVCALYTEVIYLFLMCAFCQYILGGPEVVKAFVEVMMVVSLTHAVLFFGYQRM